MKIAKVNKYVLSSYRIFVAETDNPKRSDYLWECLFDK